MKLRNLIFALFLAIGAIGFTACTGDDGADGAQGPPGMDADVDVDDIVDQVVDQISGDGMPNPDDCTIFADRSRTLVGSNRDDTLCGNERNNTIRGGDGDDTIFGREGNDHLFGQGDDDILYGGPGNDELTGGEGSDELYGEAGDDKLHAGADDDILDGGDGTDMVVYVAVAVADTNFLSVNLAEGYTERKDTAAGGADTLPTATEMAAEGEILEDLIDIEDIWGSVASDVLIGDSGDNLIGGDAGADHIDGGGGVDTASYDGSDAGVTVTLVAGTAGTGGHAEGDMLRNIENLTGSAEDDNLTGDSMNNILSGGNGADTLVGGAGNDTIVPGMGADTTLTGGEGADRFVIAKGEGNKTITDFSVTQGDKLVLVGFSMEERTARETVFTSPTFTVAGQVITLTDAASFRPDSDIIWHNP